KFIENLNSKLASLKGAHPESVQSKRILIESKTGEEDFSATYREELSEDLDVVDELVRSQRDQTKNLALPLAPLVQPYEEGGGYIRVYVLLEEAFDINDSAEKYERLESAEREKVRTQAM